MIAPTTLLAALAFYFGRQITQARASYFGIDASVLDLSTQEYVFRSADAIFVPLGMLALLGLICIQTHAVLRPHMDRPAHAKRFDVAARILLIAGGLLLASGVYGVFKDLPTRTPLLFAPLSPAAGVLLVAYGLYISKIRRGDHASHVEALSPNTQLLHRMLLVMFVVFSLFWAATDYARALGRGRSADVARRLSALPAVVVLSKARLVITGPGVREERLSGSLYAYRYTGLRLLIRSDRRYFVIPSGWSTKCGSVVVLADDPSVRFEFIPGRGEGGA